MKETRIILHVLITIPSLLGVYSTNTCSIEDQYTNCIMTVVCENYAGSASLPSCSSDPFVTFVVRKSNTSTLSAGFFGSTNFDSKVKAIKFNNNNWNALAETAFRYYSKTLYMDISNNKINIVKDLAFKNLIYLQTLNISRNEIRTLETSSLYTHDNKDSEIDMLDLSYNYLEYLRSDVFKYLGKIKELYLQHNKINELSDDVFMNLKNLTRLDLCYNNLTSFNMALINLKSLQNLDASFNRITRLAGYELNRLTSIVSINFSNNAIETVESNCFNQAFSLEVVDLKNNKIKSAVENLMFINNVKLRYLDLESNYITIIEDNSFKHNNLHYLNLEKNYISGPITESTFAGLKNISTLSLYNQSVTSLGHGAFSEMEALQVLNLSRNSISAINISSFGAMKNLSILDLSHNAIPDLIFVKNSLAHLTELILNNNKLSKVSSYQFINQTQLKKLDISMNNIKTIEQFSLPLQNLEYLNISGNFLTGTIQPDTFSPARYLRYLDLSNFNISKVNNMSFINLPVLARINLSNNIIDEIGMNNFNSVNNMYSLDLSHNRLKVLSLTTGLSNLKSLYLNNNILQSLPKVNNISGILYLDLSHNSLINISDTFFGQLKNLKALHMSYNKIKKFNNNYTNSLLELTDLSLSHNEISSVNLSYFNKLITLDISSNYLQNIDKNFLKHMDNLQALDLGNNHITKLPPGTFQNIKILKMLNLSSNHLSNLRYGSVKGLHRTIVLDISKNDITELDVDIFHECVQLEKLIIDYNKIKSIDFERLLIVTPKLNFLSLGGNPISCKEIVRNMRTSVTHPFFRPMEVTSTDKIYHEDNVHGIKCGDVKTTNTIRPEGKSIPPSEHSSALVYLVYFLVAVLFVIAVASLGLFYIKYYRNRNIDNLNSLRMQRSLDLSSCNIENDLLN